MLKSHSAPSDKDREERRDRDREPRKEAKQCNEKRGGRCEKDRREGGRQRQEWMPRIIFLFLFFLKCFQALRGEPDS